VVFSAAYSSVFAGTMMRNRYLWTTKSGPASLLNWDWFRPSKSKAAARRFGREVVLTWTSIRGDQPVAECILMQKSTPS
jgi:hypothetical protein